MNTNASQVAQMKWKRPPSVSGVPAEGRLATYESFYPRGFPLMMAGICKYFGKIKYFPCEL